MANGPARLLQKRLVVKRFLKMLALAGLLGLLGCSTQSPTMKKMFLAFSPFKKSTIMSGDRAPKAALCGECHQTIYKEWKASRHAVAFTNPVYRKVTADYAVTTCLNCHTPESVHTKADDIPLVRSVHREEGVTCIACHLQEGRLQGPLKVGLTPHPVGENNQVFLKSDLCGTCHQRAFKEWRSVDNDPEKKTCQGCHMPQVLRKTTQATEITEPLDGFFSGMATKVDAAFTRFLVRLEEAKDERRHTFSLELPELYRDAARITLGAPRLDEGALVGNVTVENTTRAHSIPTGEFGFREARLHVTATDRWGRVIADETFRFYVELNTSLKVGERREIPYRLPLKGQKALTVEAELRRLSRDGKRAAVIARSELALSGRSSSLDPMTVARP